MAKPLKFLKLKKYIKNESGDCMESEIELRQYIGRKIRLARAKSKYTQEKLAEKTSLSSRYISQLERGKSFGSATTIVSICKALNISSRFLFDELIDSSNNIQNELLDDKFLELYLQLDARNKSIVNSLTLQLIKFQDEDKDKQKLKM